MRRLLVGWAACLVILMPAAHGQAPAELAETAAFVAALQNPDGGFAPAAGQVSNLTATNAAIRALKYTGGAMRDVSACIRFVRSCRAAAGFAAAPGGAPDVHSTAVGLMAAAELTIASDELVEGAIRFFSEHAQSFEQIRIAVAGLEAVQKPSPRFPAWIEQVESDRNPDGTWDHGPGRARATGSAAVALLRMGVDLDRKAAVLAALRDGQRPDGGWSRGDEGSDLESTYRVMRAFVMLKARPDLDRLRGFLARCRRSNGGYATTPGGAADVAGTYFATVIARWMRQLTGALEHRKGEYRRERGRTSVTLVTLSLRAARTAWTGIGVRDFPRPRPRYRVAPRRDRRARDDPRGRPGGSSTENRGHAATASSG